MAEPTDFTDEERALFERLNIGKPGGLPMPSFIRPSEVVAQARPLAESIFANWDVLKTLLRTNDGQNETVLIDRWKAMKKRKRRELLAATWLSAAESLPEEYRTPLPEIHRPDLAAWRVRKAKGDGNTQTGGTGWTDKDRAAFMWPHINAHDLSQTTRPLYLMAAARSQASPDAFAESDLATTHPGRACLALQPRYLNQFSMLFSGRTTPGTYGQLFSWAELRNGNNEEDESDSFEARGTHPGEGLWILVIQARLYRFLVVTVEAVLASGSGQQDGVSKNVVDGLYVDVPLRSLEAPYCLPTTAFDLQPLLDIVFAKACEAEDHVLALRSSPEYFRTALVDWAHSQNKDLVTVDIIDGCIGDALEQIETWHIVYAKVQLVAQQMEKHATAVAEAGKNKSGILPREVLLSFYALIYHIRSFEHETVRLLQGATTTKFEPSALTSLKEDSTRQLFGQHALLDELELVLRAQQESNSDGDNTSSPASISPCTSHHVATLGIYTRCSALLYHFQPWAGAYDTTVQQDKETRDILATDFQKSMERLRGLSSHTIGVSPPSLVNTPDKSDGSKNNEHALFWESVSQSLDSGNALTPRTKDLFARQTAGSALATPGHVVKPVDRRSARVFRALFHDANDKESNTSSTPPVVTWLDVMYALKTAGFGIQRLYASAWLFVPGSGVGNGMPAQASGRQPGAKKLQPILFHDLLTGGATGTSKLTTNTASLIGKKLNRAYGWDVGTLKEE